MTDRDDGTPTPSLPMPPVSVEPALPILQPEPAMVGALGTGPGSLPADRRPDFGELLESLRATPGVIGGLVIQDDECLARRVPNAMERRLVEIARGLSVAADRSGGDDWLFELGAHHLVGRAAGDARVFAVIGRDANLGMVKVRLRMLALKIGKAMDRRERAVTNPPLDEATRLRELLRVIHRGLVSCRDVLAPLPGLGDRQDGRTLAVLDGVCKALQSGDVGGDYEVDIARSFVALAEQVTILQKDLDRAGQIQRRLLPQPGNPAFSMIDVASSYRSERHCGGDWWTIRKLDNDRALVAIADVTGHGAAAAMVTGIVDAAFHAIQDEADAAMCTDLLASVNARLRAAFGQSVLVTCCAAVIDRKTGKVTVANAGHKFPLLIRDRGGNNELQTIVARGNALGANRDSTYTAVEYQLDAGDAILWCTDGVIECADANGREFGDKRLQRVLRQVDLTGGAVAAQDAILGALGEFLGHSPIDDDLTIVVTRLA